ncbi:MAG: hypothetical protein HWE34_05525 [Methylocystaceae bacterium]|nr:hypothetical protein [Methylocystaceae bacterium]
MIDDYQEFLLKIKDQVSKIGMKLVKDTDYSAEFERPDGYRLVFEGERYYRPLVGISIRPPGEIEDFSLSILMKVYQNQESITLPAPSLDNQIDFLIANIDGWIWNTEHYKKAYKAINEPWTNN